MARAKLRRVGRPRKTPSPYPKRCYPKDGALYFVETKHIGTRPNGKPHYQNIWHWLGPLSDLQACYRQLSVLLGANDPVKTIQQLWEKYEREELVRKAPKTRRGRRNDMKWPLKVFGATQAETIEPHHIWTYWRNRGQTEQARHEIRALSTLLTFARQCGARKSDNPCFKLGLEGAKRRTLYVTDEMFYAVHDVAPPMLQFAMQLAWCAGLDEGTLIKLERRNITPTGLLFQRSKMSRRNPERVQAVDGEDLVAIVKGALAQPPQLRQFIICKRGGKPYTSNGLQTAWQRALTDAIEKGRLPAEKRFHFHDLRAKGASEAASDKAAAELLGHSDEKVTIYHYRRLPQRGEAVKIFKEKA